MDIGEEARFDRQRSLVPMETITQTPVTIIGVGAVGRQVALQLAAMGVREFLLIDFDRVEWPNVAAQGFATFEVGMHKVDAVAGAIQHYDPPIGVETIKDRWRPRHSIHEAVFCCVDSIEARAAIWKGVGERTRFWCDTRMLGDVIRVLAATDVESRSYYRTTLFAANQAQHGSCTARSTIYAASVAAGLICHRFACWLRKEPCDMDSILDLKASILSGL